MANSAQARKRARLGAQRREHNIAQRSMLRTSIKRVIKAIDAKDVAAAEAAYGNMTKLLDRYSVRGLIHKNKAARHKSRLNVRIMALKAA